jgi:hypothetical protein
MIFMMFRELLSSNDERGDSFFAREDDRHLSAWLVYVEEHSIFPCQAQLSLRDCVRT